MIRLSENETRRKPEGGLGESQDKEFEADVGPGYIQVREYTDPLFFLLLAILVLTLGLR